MNATNMTINDVFEAGLFGSYAPTPKSEYETKTHKDVSYTVETTGSDIYPYSCNCSDFKTEAEVIVFIEEVFFGEFA